MTEPEPKTESVYQTLVKNRAGIESALAKSEAMAATLAEEIERFKGENLNVIELESQIAQQNEMTARLKYHLVEIQEEFKKYALGGGD